MTEMTAIAITTPGGPEVLKPVRLTRPEPGRWRDPGQGRGGRRQPARHPAAAGRLSAAAGCARQRPALRLPARSLRSGPGVKRYQSRRQGLRAGARRRLCRILRGGGGQCLADPSRAQPGRGSRAARNLLHRLDQCLRPRRAQGRRDLPRPWRIERHRHDRHHAGQGLRGAWSSRPPDRRRNAPPALPWAHRSPSTIARTISSKRVKDATEGRGADVILDMVGGDYMPAKPGCGGDAWANRQHRLPQGLARPKSISCR